MYVCMYVCMYVRVYVCIQMPTNQETVFYCYTYVCMYACMYLREYVRMCSRAHEIKDAHSALTKFLFV